MNADVSSSPLLFNWQGPNPRKRSIVLFLCASVLLHAVCFYLFQIVYAPAVVLLPPPARVSLITPDSEEGRSVLRWVDAEDPALASATQRPPDARQRPLPRVQHIPSYVAQGPKLKQAPPFQFDTRAPSIYPPGPMPSPGRKSPKALDKIATRISFSDDFAALGAPSWPAAHFAASNNETPQAMQFRIAVDPTGEVRHCFPLNSSGDAALDMQARQQLALVRFAQGASTLPSADSSDLWGIATIDWGNDVARPAPPASPTATP